MSTRVPVRPFGASDVEAVLARAPRLTDGVAPWRDPAAVRRAVQGWLRGSIDDADRADRAVFVADGDGRVVGVVTLATRSHFAGDVDAYVGELVVDRGSARTGVGRALMAAEDWARTQGHSRLTLETGAANTAARAFYTSLGFEEEDVTLCRAIMDP